MRRQFIMIRPDICCTQTQWNMVTCRCRQYVWSLVQRHSSTSRKIIGNYLLYLHMDKIFINYFLLIHPTNVVFLTHWTRVWLVCVTWSEHCAVSRPLPLVKRWRHCPGCWATGDHLSPAPRTHNPTPCTSPPPDWLLKMARLNYTTPGQHRAVHASMVTKYSENI